MKKYWTQDRDILQQLGILWQRTTLTAEQIRVRLGLKTSYGAVARKAFQLFGARAPFGERECREHEDMEDLEKWRSSSRQLADIHAQPTKPTCVWMLEHIYTRQERECDKPHEKDSPFCREHRLEALARLAVVREFNPAAPTTGSSRRRRR